MILNSNQKKIINEELYINMYKTKNKLLSFIKFANNIYKNK